MPVPVAELELILRLEEGGDGTPPVVYSELNGSVNHLKKYLGFYNKSNYLPTNNSILDSLLGPIYLTTL
jgi:hypothetical protein